MIATKNWVRVINFEIIKQVNIGLASIFQLADAKTTTFVAPSIKEFPEGGRFFDSVVLVPVRTLVCYVRLFDIVVLLLLVCVCISSFFLL